MIATPFLSVFCPFGNPLLRLVQDLSYLFYQHNSTSHLTQTLRISTLQATSPNTFPLQLFLDSVALTLTDLLAGEQRLFF